MSYAKLFSEIVTSTIWGEDDATRIVWITMLATADKHGEVMASVPGLARMANVSVEAARKAIHTLSSPDPDSRTPDDEGRRIQPIDGGWLLINYPKYREKATAIDRAEKARIRQQRWRDRQSRNANVTPSNASDTPTVSPVTPKRIVVTQESRQNCQAEAEAEADVQTPTPAAREAMESSRMEQQILTLLSFFDIRTGIATVGKSALDAFLAQPQFLEDDALEVIRERAGPWLAQDWIRDVNPRFIAERLSEIYHYKPTKNNHGTHQASSRSRSSGTVGTCNEGKSSQYRGIKSH